MANYDVLKASMDKNGEVMIRSDTGEKLELHKHNAEVRLNKKKTSGYDISLSLNIVLR